MTNGRDPKLELSVEAISPRTAKEWLETNTHNRKVSDRLVDIYAEAMSAGEWVLNGEPIIFDKNGRLQSGQHRLLAVIESKTTIKSVVVRGAEPESLYSLDAGRRRRMTDVLQLRGEKDVANLAATLVWHWRYQHALMDRPGVAPTNTHLLTVLDETPELRTFLTWGRTLHNKVGVSAGLGAALFFEFAQLDLAEAEAFFIQVCDGENLTADDPAYSLRRWINRATLSVRKPPAAMYAAVIIKTWNAYREHTPLRALRWGANEEFPEAI